MDVGKTTDGDRGANPTQPITTIIPPPLTAVIFFTRDKLVAERYANDLAADWQATRGGAHNDLLLKISPSQRVMYLLTRGQFIFIEVNFDNNSSDSTET